MPMTVKVGLAKKVGQPDFGSLGASCDIELELDGGLLFSDLEGLQKKIQTAYVACRQAVNDELASRHRTEEPPHSVEPSDRNGHSETSLNDHQRRILPENAPNLTNGHSNGKSANGKVRTATNSQVRALRAIASRQGFNLTEHLQGQFNLQRAEDLTVRQASQLIDDLNQSATPNGVGSGGRS